MSCAISFQNVEKIFQPDVCALQNINLDVADGERLVVVGPSGCGKSTLLRLVSGLEDLSNGSILLFGKDCQDVPPGKRDIGMVFQNYALFPHLSAFENMAYGLRVRKESSYDIEKKVQEVAQKLSIAELLQRNPHELSGGQRQRVALGRLLVRDPKIHLFDEPLGNLDPQFRLGMRSELARLHEENPRPSLYVTHDQAEAMTLGQRICVLLDGQILQTGTPDEIYNTPSHRFVAQFFGSPGACCIDGRIDRNSENIAEFNLNNFKLPLPGIELPNGSITLGVRPEDWQICEPGTPSIHEKISRVENLGDHRLIEIKLKDSTVFIKTQRTDLLQGEAISFQPDLKRVHWFERYTGKRIP
ncbi:MAG: ABC transporter ATP-binding protein [Opitutales bacterium]